MPLSDLNRHYASKGWFEEVARRIEEFDQHGTKEIITPTGCFEEPLQPRDHALLSTTIFQLKNHYQRAKKSEQRIVNRE